MAGLIHIGSNASTDGRSVRHTGVVGVATAANRRSVRQVRVIGSMASIGSRNVRQVRATTVDGRDAARPLA
jgi:hypothetical protein